MEHVPRALSHSVLPVSQEAAGIVPSLGGGTKIHSLGLKCHGLQVRCWFGLSAGVSSQHGQGCGRGPVSRRWACHLHSPSRRCREDLRVLRWQGVLSCHSSCHGNQSEIVAGSPQLLLKPDSSPPVSTSSWGRWFLAATLPRCHVERDSSSGLFEDS